MKLAVGPTKTDLTKMEKTMSELSGYSLKELKELKRGIFLANINNPAWIRDRETEYVKKEIESRN